MSKVRIAVFVSGGGTNLGALIKAQNKGILTSGEIALVLSNKRSAYALTRAKNAGIPTEVVIRAEEGGQEGFEQKIKSLLDQYKIDIIVLAGFMTILSEQFTSAYPERIINVHPSLIPAFCGKGYYGLKVHEEALARGVKVTGATVHFVNEIPDGGKIIMQKAVAVKEGDTAEILQQRVMRLAEWVILPRAVQEVCKNIKGE
ncbi:MAG: phosphoribosylglycinamide formyltransferase [Clostridia bacterium]|nr:phosphoribosylglycinamide formyltransferase [Clostridia bacterium]